MSTRQLAIRAWREYKAAKQFSDPAGWNLMTEAHIPGWFIRDELGFGLGCGPSILVTYQKLREGDRTLALIERKYGRRAKAARMRTH